MTKSLVRKLIFKFFGREIGTDFDFLSFQSNFIHYFPMVLRGFLYSLVKKKSLDFFFIGKDTSIRGKKISIKKGTIIDDFSSLIAPHNSRIEIGLNSRIGKFSILETYMSFNSKSKSEIILGDNVAIGAFSYIGGASKVEIGPGTIAGQYLSIHPQNHNFKQKQGENIDIRLMPTTEKGIKIGKGTWIGAKVTILDGVSIGNYSVIAAGSVVTKNIPSYELWAGIPARKLRGIDE